MEPLDATLQRYTDGTERPRITRTRKDERKDWAGFWLHVILQSGRAGAKTERRSESEIKKGSNQHICISTGVLGGHQRERLREITKGEEQGRDCIHELENLSHTRKRGVWEVAAFSFALPYFSFTQISNQSIENRKTFILYPQTGT